MCGTHFRRFCPPRSRRRRAYNEFFRRGKRYGWDAGFRSKFWRFWHTFVSVARRQASDPTVIGLGSIDMAALEQAIGPIAPEELVIR